MLTSNSPWVKRGLAGRKSTMRLASLACKGDSCIVSYPDRTGSTASVVLRKKSQKGKAVDCHTGSQVEAEM